MTVNELCEKCGFSAVVVPDGDREVTGCYIGDLLSWVMGRAKGDDAWITIMSNINIIAVASLADVSCIILAEGAQFDEATLQKAITEEIVVFTTPLPVFDAALKVHESAD